MTMSSKKNILFSLLFLIVILVAGTILYFFKMPSIELISQRKSFAQLTTLLKTGDLIFQTTKSLQSGPIAKATHSPITHVGILEKTDSGWMVIEARNPVRYVPVDTFLKDGASEAIAIRRAKFTFDAEKLVSVAKQSVGKPYDLLFEWDDDKIYCSELSGKAFYEASGKYAGKFEKVKTLDFSDFSVQLLMLTRLKPRLNLKEKQIFHEMLTKYKTFEAWENSQDWKPDFFETRILEFLNSRLISPASQYEDENFETIYTDYSIPSRIL